MGRYTELNYVFSILKQNDQFEFLLSKASKRDQRLKTACIEYLKKFCPDDRKLYELVAVHFNLYSETATIWEREAQGCIKNLLAIALAEMQNAKSNQGQSFDFLLLTKSHGTHLLLQNVCWTLYTILIVINVTCNRRWISMQWQQSFIQTARSWTTLWTLSNRLNCWLYRSLCWRTSTTVTLFLVYWIWRIRKCLSLSAMI